MSADIDEAVLDDSFDALGPSSVTAEYTDKESGVADLDATLDAARLPPRLLRFVFRSEDRLCINEDSDESLPLVLSGGGVIARA